MIKMLRLFAMAMLMWLFIYSFAEEYTFKFDTLQEFICGPKDETSNSTDYVGDKSVDKTYNPASVPTSITSNQLTVQGTPTFGVGM